VADTLDKINVYLYNSLIKAKNINPLKEHDKSL